MWTSLTIVLLAIIGEAYYSLDFLKKNVLSYEDAITKANIKCYSHTLSVIHYLLFKSKSKSYFVSQYWASLNTRLNSLISLG